MKSWNWWRNKRNVQKMCARELCKLKRKEAVITQRDSRGVPHRSTNRALRRLTSEFRWDPVHSTQYERRQTKHSSKYTQPLPSSPHMLQTKTTQIQPTNPYFASYFASFAGLRQGCVHFALDTGGAKRSTRMPRLQICSSPHLGSFM